ncbi:MAG: aminoglycoside phosphotransferase family protein [Chloroflexota bacterium]
MKMHTDEVDTSTDLVRRLLTAQFPEWSNLTLKRVTSTGTDNAIYRLGDTMSVRLPRIHWATGQIDKEFEWLPKLAPHLPFQVPVPLVKGQPTDEYPHQWAVYQWLAGKNSADAHISDLNQAAIDIAQFLTALRQIDTTGGPSAKNYNIRGMPLALRDEETRKAIAKLEGMIDTQAAITVWEAALDAQPPHHEPVWLHGDLLSGNILINQGRVHAIIDFGGLAVGDPTCDLMIAWSLFTNESRAVLWDALEVDEATWLCGRGHALSQAAIFIPYYLETNPIGMRNARRMLDEILLDIHHNSV